MQATKLLKSVFFFFLNVFHKNHLYVTDVVPSFCEMWYGPSVLGQLAPLYCDTGLRSPCLERLPERSHLLSRKMTSTMLVLIAHMLLIFHRIFCSEREHNRMELCLTEKCFTDDFKTIRWSNLNKNWCLKTSRNQNVPTKPPTVSIGNKDCQILKL